MDSEHIFHIAQKSEWQAAESYGIYQSESLNDAGFIHCCFQQQIDKVLQHWFAGVNNLVLVEIDPQKINEDIRIENLEGNSEKFPHIYGPINFNAVIKVSGIKNFRSKGK